MVSEKESVSSVTIVERDKNAISLFRDIILPQMPRKDKINIICDDAFYFAETRLADSDFDFVFADIWHDPSDGVPAYKRLKETEKYLPSADFSYWIEKTLKCYI